MTKRTKQQTVGDLSPGDFCEIGGAGFKVVANDSDAVSLESDSDLLNGQIEGFDFPVTLYTATFDVNPNQCVSYAEKAEPDAESVEDICRRWAGRSEARRSSGS